jgi:lipopolysaccharide transport system ATP-binding protein
MSGDDIAIKVSGLSKCYHIYNKPHDRLKQSIYPLLQRLVGKPAKQYCREFWALKNVSFEIKKGETVGIVGRNGSGKSSLLQMICGTLNPTSGSVHTNGRIAALLELGSGFNQEFTGRENVYMNGAILGLSQGEIDARFEDVVDFADIGEFIEQPVKVYSSGMQVRLAFAVAINVAPQILVVDEALSVGDALFQRKCFSRIEAIKQSGATILFVSHSAAQIVNLCDRALLVDGGELLVSGLPKHVVGIYQKLHSAPVERRNEIRAAIAASAHSSLSQQQVFSDQPKSAAKNHEGQEFYDPHLRPQSTIAYEPNGALIEQPKLIALDGKQVNSLRRGLSYQYCYRVSFWRNANRVRFGMLIKTVSGIELGGATSAPNSQSAVPCISAGTIVDVKFRFQCCLNTGVYFLNAGVVAIERGEETILHRMLDACMFRVLPESAGISTGAVDFGCIHEVTMLATARSV